MLIKNVSVVACIRFGKFHHNLVQNSVRTISTNEIFPQTKNLDLMFFKKIFLFVKGQELVAFIQVPVKQPFLSVSRALVKDAGAQMAKQV